ncbi:MAG: hypothetical protein LBB34_01220 [Holosporales bacterium]|jgi:hypothetical protein|nr:hypothetical protein [Holosporales bacterium]
MAKLPRMRKADGVFKIIKEIDPDTNITLCYIKQLIRAEVVPVIRVSSMHLVDADKLIAYIAKGPKDMCEKREKGVIRRVKT